MLKIRVFRTQTGKQPYFEWLQSLRDATLKMRISKRIQRLMEGNFGDCKAPGRGIYELRFFFGAGYPVYFGQEKNTIILLLCGGDKSTQVDDVAKAVAYWDEYLEKRSEDDETLH